jgi:hypothetical protein
MNAKIKAYMEMSPFEIKNTLIQMAEKACKNQKSKVLNAGRGNPNF